MQHVSRRAALLCAILLAALAAPSAATASEATDCDGFATQRCLMPFPNDMNLTVADGTSRTGRRVRLSRAASPRNAQGRRADTGEINRQDGFSLGQPIVLKVRGLTSTAALNRSRLPRVTDIGASLDDDSGLVLLDSRTGERVPAWAELDANAERAADRVLILHPAESLAESRRYVVALRGLRTASGKRIARPAGFRALVRDAGPKRLRYRYRRLFSELRRAGVERGGLTMAWDFTTTSKRSVQSRLLRIRDDAFGDLGDRNLADGRIEGNAPSHTVTSLTDYAPCGTDGCQEGESDVLARRVAGTYSVPCYLNRGGCPPGSRFSYPSGGSRDATPQRLAGNVSNAPFICQVPRTALTAPAPGLLFGHGFLQTVESLDQFASEVIADTGRVTCGTTYLGLSGEDAGAVLASFQDFGNVPAVVDRLQQGTLNMHFLGRLMAHPEGLAADPALQAGGRRLLEPSLLGYFGISQGGINGVVLTATSPDIPRSVLNVPGMTEVGLIVNRSRAADALRGPFFGAYPDAADRQLGLAIAQMLFDRGEAGGWARHATTNPPAGSPVHSVLLQMAFGDQTVPNIATTTLARSIGARVRRPALAVGRSPEAIPLFGLTPVGLPNTSPLLVVYDSGAPSGALGVPAPLPFNQPGRGGADPHAEVIQTTAARRQAAEFLSTGSAPEVCGTAPCRSTGPRSVP